MIPKLRTYSRGASWSAEDDLLVAATIGQRNSLESDAILAAKLHRTAQAIQCRRTYLVNERKRQSSASMPPDFGAGYMPTPEQIAASAAEIRRGWSAKERESRIMDSRAGPADE